MNIHSLVFLILVQFPFVFHQSSDFRNTEPLPSSPQKVVKTGAVNIVFKSNDGGNTWQDISDGLPENVEAGGMVEKDNNIYIRSENGVYRTQSNSTAPFWQKEFLPSENSSIVPVKTGMFAYNYNGQFLQKVSGTSIWMPMYTNFPIRGVRALYETASGAAFIGANNGLFKSTDGGKNWNLVYTGGWVMKVIESQGVLLATSQSGIIRSTDDGENWDNVISEGGVGIAVETIKGGFAAITCNTESETRRVRTSYDGGKTWQAIDAGLPASLYTASIAEIGEYLFCGHPAGIFRSADKGKTWKLILPSIEDRVFNLSVSGNNIYAIPKGAGC